MQKLATIRFYLNSDKSKNSSQKKIYLRVTINRKKLEKFIGYTINPKDWDDKKQRSKMNLVINQRLSQIEREIQSFEHRQNESGTTVTIDDLKQLLTDGKPKKNGLIGLFNGFIELRMSDNTLRHDRLNKYKAVYQSLVDFLSEKYNCNEVGFQKVNYDFIVAYDHYLKGRKSKNTTSTLHHNTRSNYHKILKRIIREAQNREMISTNPYNNFKITIQNSSRTYLTKEEILAIKKVDLRNNESLENTRDIFLFSVYTGLRFEDAQKLTTDNLFIDEEENYTIRFVQNKTNGENIIPLFPQGIELLKRFETNKRKLPNQLLPQISNQKTNTYLKVIADLAQISKPLTHHVARHTFATTVTLENGLDINTVSSLLGHTSLKHTKVYAKMTEFKLRNEISKISGKIL